jgi:hypothetical protein
MASAALVITGEARAGNIFTPGDPIIAIDRDGGFSDAPPPANEGPANLIDGDLATTKYLNFGKEGSGIIITANNAAVAKRIGFLTANDTPERDPTTIRLYGTNSPITSTTGSAGKSEPWTLIYSGGTGLATDPGRGFDAYVDLLSNNASYQSYKAVFPTVRNASATNSMQLTEMQMYTAAGATNNFFNQQGGIFAPGNPVVAIDEWQSRSSVPNETAQKAIDGVYANSTPGNTNNTKYLNFGRENSGFIVTPSKGATIARSFQIVTGNDSVNRDPASYQIYGTNDPIVDLDNSNGDGENWTLISSGPLSLPDLRTAMSDAYGFDNSTPYTSYKIVFPTVKNSPTTANSMQLSEFILSDTAVPEPGLAGALAVGSLVVLRRRRR